MTLKMAPPTQVSFCLEFPQRHNYQVEEFKYVLLLCLLMKTGLQKVKNNERLIYYPSSCPNYYIVITTFSSCDPTPSHNIIKPENIICIQCYSTPPSIICYKVLTGSVNSNSNKVKNSWRGEIVECCKDTFWIMFPVNVCLL